jgi:hypothetical protein
LKSTTTLKLELYVPEIDDVALSKTTDLTAVPFFLVATEKQNIFAIRDNRSNSDHVGAPSSCHVSGTDAD